MRRLSTKQNVQPPDGDYIYGRIKDNPGNNTGTPFNESLYGDIQQFFERMFDKSGIVANGLPDQSYTGFQLYDAFIRTARPYYSYTVFLVQTSTSAPVANVIENQIGTALGISVTWTRLSAGLYQASFSSASPGAVVPFISNELNGMCLTEALAPGSTQLTLKTTGLTGTLSDGILVNAGLELRFYK